MSDASSSTAHSSLIMVVVTATAAAVAVGLAVIQTDWAGRKLLTPTRLIEKRFQSYIYAWNQAMELYKLKLEYFRSFGRNNHSDQVIPVSRIIETDDEMQQFVQEIIAMEKSSQAKYQYRIAKIDTSNQLNNNGNEHSLYCFAHRHDEDDVTTTTETELIQMDTLSKFGMQLADQFEKIISTVTFCFLYDVAAGEASTLCTGLLQSACKENVRIIPNPTWLIQLGILAQQRVYATSKIQKMIFALCRWEAAAVVSSTGGRNTDINTIVVTIPMAMTPTLLPLLHDIFPDDRHVFAYTGCVQTCGYASVRRNTFHKTHIPQTLELAIQWDNPVAYTTPIQKWNSVHTMPPFPSALAALPVDIAGTVECWTAAVDMYLVRKEALPATAFLPYVCKIDYLLSATASSDKAAEIWPGTPQYWAVRSLLQYMTGHKSRELSSETMDAAIAYLRDYRRSSDDGSSLLHHPYAKEIENVVFHHKLILIANKILLDTVAPTEHWTLKQAMKRGCACCMPEEDDEEEERIKANKYVDGKNTFAFDPTAFTKAAKQSNYTDGKSGFAFDPTKF